MLFYLLFEGIDLLPILLLFLIVPGDAVLKIVDVLGELGFVRVEGLDLIGGNNCDVISEDNMQIAKNTGTLNMKSHQSITLLVSITNLGIS